jgi:hypothetical protein
VQTFANNNKFHCKTLTSDQTTINNYESASPATISTLGTDHRFEVWLVIKPILWLKLENFNTLMQVSLCLKCGTNWKIESILVQIICKSIKILHWSWQTHYNYKPPKLQNEI